MASKKPRRKNPDAVLQSLNKTRCSNLRSLVGEGKRFDSQHQLAVALGLTDGSYLSQLMGPNPSKRFTENIARKFEYKLKLDNGWLDVVR